MIQLNPGMLSEGREFEPHWEQLFGSPEHFDGSIFAAIDSLTLDAQIESICEAVTQRGELWLRLRLAWP